MPAVVTVLVVVAILIVIGLYLRSRGGGVATRSLAGAIPKAAAAMSEVDFKVHGATAHVYFDTHIPAGGADDVLVGLMAREATRVFEGKATHLPLEEVKHIVVHGKQGDAAIEVTRVDLRQPAEMDHMDEPGAPRRAADVAALAEDPLSVLHEMEFSRQGGYRGGSDELPPLTDDLKIPSKVVDAVAGPGGTLEGMSLQDFITGLLRTTGYEVQLSGDSGTARKAGSTTYLQFVDHEAGSHPELSEKAVDGFVMRFMSSGADRGMLFTPKFGPYSVYEKERRNGKVKYMTRERLQAFVDSVAMT